MGGRTGRFRSEAGREAYAQAYAAAMATLPHPSRTDDLPTPFGMVRSYSWVGGDPGRTPLVLLPGRSSGVPMWSDNLPGLLESGRTIVAMDALGDAGLSVQTAPIQPFARRSWRDHALARIGGVSVDEVRADSPIGTMISVGAREFRAALPNPRPLTDDQLARLTMPVYVAIAGDQSLAGGQRASVRAAQLPDATVEVWPGTTHSLPMQVTEPLARRLRAFWDAHP